MTKTDYQKWPVICPECSWRGQASQCPTSIDDKGAFLVCPKCNKEVSYIPLDKLTPQELAAARPEG